MDSKRQLKYAKLIQEEISAIFQKEAKNFLGNIFLTITAVKVSPDLSFAKIYISLIEERNRKINFELLNEHKSELRKFLGNRIGKQVRIVPEIAFVLDETEEKAAKIDQLLAQLNIPPAPKED